MLNSSYKYPIFQTFARENTEVFECNAMCPISDNVDFVYTDNKRS